MPSTKLLYPTLLTVATGLAAVVASIATAQSSQNEHSAAQDEMPLPPGWTEEDMQACVIAGMPGKQHQRLAEEAGTWRGTTTMWMAPGAEPMSCPATMILTPIMDGRYVQCQMHSEMPGMGLYLGEGVYGYDNVSQQFVSTWIDNHNTGIMTGRGVETADGRTITWTYTYNCPINKKPVEMREVATKTGPNSKKLEMYGDDPKTGEHYKMMVIELTRKAGAGHDHDHDHGHEH